MTYTQSDTQSGAPSRLDASHVKQGVDGPPGLPAGTPPPMKGAPVPTPVTSPERFRTSPTRFHSEETRLTSPIQLLGVVAQHSLALKAEVMQLVCAITGEAPPAERMRDMPRPGGGLLPAIATLAHEIEQTQAEIARLVEHVRGRL